ncbi:hypothetical protein GGI06_002623 [Coemansia sp. S85]|nr:hypothetical protein GGI06_002623 [Coemansia sp. S85]
MSPVTRRQSMRLAEQADKEAEKEQTPTKPEPKARVVASRYMSATNPRKPEARSQIQFDENKAAAAEELERLSREAENAKRLLVDEQRKLKLMREYSALSTWLAANKQTLVAMGAQVSRVREPYTRFSEQLKQTTRAMPISGVYFRDGESLVSDMQGFVDAVDRNFPKSSENVQGVFKMATRVNQYYKGLAQEQDLVAECERLRQSLEHTAVLAISSKLGSASETS